MVVFIYLAPCFTAVGLAWFVPGERMNARQWLGVLTAFGGLVLAFADAFSAARGTLLGDLFGLVGGVLAQRIAHRTPATAADSFELRGRRGAEIGRAHV